MAQEIYLHIGVPKSGSTFVQEVLWSNQERLSQLRCSLAAESYQDHIRAMADLCARRTGPRITGAWDRLAAGIAAAPRRVVISQEQLCRASTEQVATAIESLRPARTTLVITVRDLVRQVASNWQQQVKSRYVGTLPEFVELIRSRDPEGDGLFWDHQDVLRIVDSWLAFLSPERVVVVTLPPAGSAPELLWRRFATACDLEPGGFDLDVQRPNESLGSAQVEVLRRINLALGDRLPSPSEYAQVRRLVANDLLARQRDQVAFGLDESAHAYATSLSHTCANGLRERKVRVVGELSDLEPAPWAPSIDPSTVDEDKINSTAMTLLADLLAQWEERGGTKPRRPPDGLGGAHRRVV